MNRRADAVEAPSTFGRRPVDRELPLSGKCAYAESMLHVSRRAFLRSTGAAAGALSVAQVTLGQTQPASPQAPQVPEDPTKVQGQNPSPLGERSPFEQPQRL